MIMAKNRKDILIRNTKFGVLKIIFQYIFQFLLRTVFIRVLGREYLGLNGLFSNVLGCLSIVELGMGSAIVYSMYKPIAENDEEKVKALYNLYKKMYYVISSVITALGLILLPFINVIIKGDIPTDINIYVIYLITLFNTVVGYIGAHNRSLLFANQRNDIESKISILTLFVLYTTQIVGLVLTKNYYVYICSTMFFTILENILLFVSVKKIFPNIRGKAKPLDVGTKKEISKNVLALGMQQVGGALVTSTDNILISSMIGLAILGSYSNYNTIIAAVTSCFMLITTATRSTAGNLIASENVDYVQSRFTVFNFMMSWLAGYCTICLLCLLNPFILIWTKSADYLLDISIVVVLIINFFISNTLTLCGTFKVSAGLMWYDKWKTIIQGIINLIFSILFTKLWGVIGIFLGTLTSYIVPLITEPYVLHKHYFKKKQHVFWIKYIIFAIVTMISALITYMLCNLMPLEGVIWFIIRCLICIIIPNIIYLICYFKTNEFKECYKILKELMRKIFK